MIGYTYKKHKKIKIWHSRHQYHTHICYRNSENNTTLCTCWIMEKPYNQTAALTNWYMHKIQSLFVTKSSNSTLLEQSDNMNITADENNRCYVYVMLISCLLYKLVYIIEHKCTIKITAISTLFWIFSLLLVLSKLE